MSRSAAFLSSSLILAIVAVANAFDHSGLSSLIKFKEIQGGDAWDDMNHPHDDVIPRHDDGLGDTEWLMDGVIEFDSTPWGCDYVVNRTTIPVGHCIKNLFTRKGEFARVGATWPDMNNMIQMVSQGFEDPHCKKPIGRAFQGAVYNGCMEGYASRYSPRRTPHGIGLNTRLYHADACYGGHIDVWSADYQCTSGSLWNPDAKSYISGCGYDYAYEYMMDGCMGESTMYVLSETPMGQCQSVAPNGPNPAMTIERVCGGQMPHWTDYPTGAPSMSAVYTSIAMPNTPYNGGFSSSWDAPQYYSFQWSSGNAPSGSGDAVYLQALTGDVRMYVFYSSMSTGDCTPGNNCYSCLGYASYNSSASVATCAFDDYFNEVCGGDMGCTVKIAVQSVSGMASYGIWEALGP